MRIFSRVFNIDIKTDDRLVTATDNANIQLIAAPIDSAVKKMTIANGTIFTNLDTLSVTTIWIAMKTKFPFAGKY